MLIQRHPIVSALCAHCTVKKQKLFHKYIFPWTLVHLLLYKKISFDSPPGWKAKLTKQPPKNHDYKYLSCVCGVDRKICHEGH